MPQRPSQDNLKEVAHASLEPAQAGHQQQQQAASSAKHEGSATQRSGSRQKQEGSAGSRRFTPAQQAVAAALVAVLKQAMTGGREAVNEAYETLLINNRTTLPMALFICKLLLGEGLLPTMQMMEQRASVEIWQSLTILAEQCKAADLQPLEVFSRSVQCTMRKAKVNIINLKYLLPGLSQGLQQLGAQKGLADLIEAYMEALAQRPYDDSIYNSINTLEICLHHMLPGSPQCFDI